MLLVYFIYGLAFFSMGLAMALESTRFPLLTVARAVRALAVFGLLHGIHEWTEIFLRLGGPEYASVHYQWLRLGILAASFLALIAYGVQELGTTRFRAGGMDIYAVFGMFALYIALIALTGHAPWNDQKGWIMCADALARYVLAVPGSILAAAALFVKARAFKLEERPALERNFRRAAWGFFLYGLTQLFVSPADMFPADFLNSATFLSVTGFPIQLLRAGIALIPTVSLINAIEIKERERQQELQDAQQSRLEALELVQQELLKREALRRELLRRTVIAQEEERKRIARELHDETAQILTAASLNIATLKNLIEKHPDVAELLGRLKAQCGQMAHGIHRLVHDLRPAQLDDLGLIPALRYLADEVRQSLGIEVSLDISGNERRLDSLVETVLFRITQEALTNIARHADTAGAALKLNFEPRRIILQVRDKGTGFDPDDAGIYQHGLGLAGMRERAESLNGRLRIHSAPGKGTLIEATIPLKADSEDYP